MTARRIAPFLAVLLAAISFACSSNRGGTPVAERNVITYEEVTSFEARTTAREMIRRLRPAWLQRRGNATLRTGAPVAIYVNRQRRNEADILDRYTAEEISEIRFLNAIDATTAFGTDHSAGAILISLR